MKRAILRKRTRHRAGEEQGAAIVEATLVLLTLLGMIVFILDMGRILLMQQYIGARAQATVRQAAVNNWSSTDVQNYLVYNSPSGVSGGQNGSPPGLMGLTTSEVSYRTIGTPNTPDYLVQVTVSGVPAFQWIPYIAGRFSLPTIVATAPAQSLGATN